MTELSYNVKITDFIFSCFQQRRENVFDKIISIFIPIYFHDIILIDRIQSLISNI